MKKSIIATALMLTTALSLPLQATVAYKYKSERVFSGDRSRGFEYH